jgi:hypothetical protein
MVARYLSDFISNLQLHNTRWAKPFYGTDGMVAPSAGIGFDMFGLLESAPACRQSHRRGLYP